MAYINQQKYYTNDGVNPTDENWGSYQYVTLEDIVNNFELMYAGNHELINNENRFKILFHAKRGIQELNYDAFKEIKALELTGIDDLRFVLPADYVNWVKLYLLKTITLRELEKTFKFNQLFIMCNQLTSSFTYDGDGNATEVDSDFRYRKKKRFFKKYIFKSRDR